jgi:hypothetical protein
VKKNIIRYGNVTDDVCPNCGRCCDFEFIADYKCRKVFFFSLGDRDQKYFLKCRNCGKYTETGGLKAQQIIDRNFSGIESRRKRKRLLGNLMVFIIMAAAALGATALIMSDGTIRYKNMIVGKPDGYYEIYGRNGDFLAAVTKRGDTRFDVYVKRETVYAEDYSDIDEDLFFEYYFSDQGNGLKYIEEDAAVLRDKMGVTLRYYFYDPEEDDIFYYFGVDDLDSILYSENRGVYPMTFYADTNKRYTKVYERNDKYETVLMFSDALETIDVYTWDGGRVVLYESYYAPEGQDMGPEIQTISIDSRIGEIFDALLESGMEPAYSAQFSYYEGTNVVESVFIRSIDPETGIKVNNSIDYIVEEKDGCYIVAPDIDKFGEKMVRGAGPESA